MKEAFLMGVLAMSNNVDDGDINIQHVVTPVAVSQNGEQVLVKKNQYIYSLTANDTKVGEPHIVRKVTLPEK